MSNVTNTNQGVGIMPLVQVKQNFQITIPAKLRKVLKLQEGDFIEAELIKDKFIVLKPKSVVNKARSFSKKEIDSWIEDDELDEATLAKAKRLVGLKK